MEANMGPDQFLATTVKKPNVPSRINNILADALLIIAYISTMLKQDLQSLVLAGSCSKVQWRAIMVERVHTPQEHAWTAAVS
jgi:hypothetical protein